jgi:RHS repeat-associated protein
MRASLFSRKDHDKPAYLRAIRVRTRYDYDNSTGRKSVTTYRVDIDEDDLPGSGTTTTFYRDGRKEKIEGCGSCGGIDQYFHFEIPATYQRRSTTYKGVNYGPRYSETTIDGLGRTTRQERASFDSDHDQTPGEEYVQQVYTYNGSTGLLTKLQETGVADRLFEYDHFGRMSRSGLNVGGGTTLANGSSDRIEATDWQYLYADDSWWMETKREMPVITSTGANSSSVQVVSLERQRLTGKAAYTLSEAFAEDAFGNRTWTRQIVTPANRELRGYVDVPDAGSTQSTTGSPQYDSYSITVAGRPVASMGADGAFKVTNRFDAQGRIREQYDSHAGYVRTDYEDYKNNASYYGVTTMPVSIYEAQNSSHFSAAGKILTKLTYDSMGRLSVEESLENTGPDVYVATRRSFDAYDRVTKVWGHVPYPVEYNYHSVYGHKEKMKTYRAGSGWSASTWPGSPGTADVTTFEVDPQSGLLWKRIDGDTSGDTTEHIYDLRGNRTLLNQANGKSIKFTYSGSTSELTAIDYGNNGSNEESFVYNRLGSLNSITDASGTRSFRFSFISGFPYVSREILGSFYNAPSSVSRSLYNDVFDASNPPSTGDAYGKSRRMRLVSGSTDDLIYLYDYDSYGRIDTITYNAGSHAQLQIDYNFWANSSLPSTRLIKRSGLTRVWSEHSWDDNRYQLNEVETRLFSSTGPVMAQHYYTYNELGKRTAEFKRGYAFNHYGVNGIAREYEYNSRGELTSAIDYLDNSSTIGTLNFSTATVVNGRRWSYNFDNQGNRSGADGRKFFFDSSSDSSETYYTAAYNEFTWIARTVDRSVSGSSSASSIQARGRTTDSWVSADIQGDHYWKAFQYTVPFDGHIIEERQARNGSTSAILSSEKEVITDAWDQIIYDASGNMTQDDLWWYTYDEANRLVKMDSKMATDLGKHETLVFACDYMGRRIRKEHWTSDNFSTNWVKVDEERYVYNGWNVVAIVEADGSYRRRLAWGLDVSGSGQGAGGVGGLVGIFDDEDGREYSPIYDGNGNVTGIVDLISQQLDAEYEYSPFGETIRSEGSYEAENHYRFSTKEVDLESKLYYYGLRYYAPRLGRFVNRDPIQEAGGQNLYGFVRNDPVNGTEFLGLCGVETFYYSTWECTGPLECAVVGRSFRVVTGCDDLFKIDREGPDFRYDSESSSAELPSKRGGPLCRNGGKTLPSYPTIPQLESFLGDDTNIGSNDGLTPAHFRGIMNNPAFDWANRGTREVSVFVGVYSGANVGGLARAAGPFLWDVGSKTAIGTWEFAKDGYALTSGAVGWATSAVVGKGIQTSASLTTRYSGEQLIGMAEIGLSVAGGAVMAWKDDDVSIDGFVPGTDPSQSARNQVGGFVGGVSSLAVKQVFGRLGDLGSDGDEDEDETEGGDCGE